MKVLETTHQFRGYWRGGAVCRIEVYVALGQPPLIVATELPENENTSITNMAEYLAAEVIEGHCLPTPLVWIEHYPEHEGEAGEWSLVRFSNWEVEEVCLGGAWRYRLGPPKWSSLCPEEMEALTGRRATSAPFVDEVAQEHRESRAAERGFENG